MIRKNQINADLNKTILLVFFLVPSRSKISAQGINLSFQTFTTQEGLADNNIHCIIQDSKGFMWFGSEEGLHRYDGYNLKIYRSNNDGTGFAKFYCFDSK